MNDTRIITLERNSTLEERQIALRRIYAQVLERQPYESERKMLASQEKDFLSGKLGIRHFLQALGNSSLYLNQFLYNSSNLKFVEGCFKHFLGRTPKDRYEVEMYMDILMKQGTSKVISEMTGSEEYRKTFGLFTVPHPRFMKLSTYMYELGLAHKSEPVAENSIMPEADYLMTLEAEAEELVKALQNEENARRAVKNMPPGQRAQMRYAAKTGR
ncbi:phycobilisome rod-core linker polypeptide [Pseudanabaena sp. PCC 6802]|uniref:phycobilisome rod-core linker polypeptide n=1 Tax=Pseudanabaena sp. PCC 6802 TaxID=118173 RepID=UPI0003693010|nr:phycobilisome rod-core linker polypeptide [Pseudanabaena sp. PCC 6802]